MPDLSDWFTSSSGLSLLASHAVDQAFNGARGQRCSAVRTLGDPCRHGQGACCQPGRLGNRLEADERHADVELEQIVRTAFQGQDQLVGGSAKRLEPDDFELAGVLSWIFPAEIELLGDSGTVMNALADQLASAGGEESRNDRAVRLHAARD